MKFLYIKMDYRISENRDDNFKQKTQSYEEFWKIKQDHEFNLTNLCTYCKKGDLESLKKMYENNLIKEWMIKEVNNNYNCFAWASYRGHLDVCKWLYFNFKINRELIIFQNNWLLEHLVNLNDYKMIKFLFDVVGLTNEDVFEIKDKITEEEIQKLWEFVAPFGSSTKPVAMR
jgi:hypothetical protein